MLATVVIFYAEIVIFTFLMGASFGQRILSLRVINIDGGRLSLWRIMLRTLLIVLVIPALVMGMSEEGMSDEGTFSEGTFSEDVSWNGRCSAWALWG